MPIFKKTSWIVCLMKKKASCKKIQALVVPFRIKFKNTPNNNMHYLCIHAYVVEKNN